MGPLKPRKLADVLPISAPSRAEFDYGDNRLPRRFWSKVYPEPNTGCWLWGAAWTDKGYGNFGLNYRNVTAHRLAYETLVRPVPDGLFLDHLCRMRCCCNPDHLEPVTPRENTLRGESPSAKNSVKTACPQGHPYDEDNTIVVRRPGDVLSRECRICVRVRYKLWEAGAPTHKELWYRHQLALSVLDQRGASTETAALVQRILSGEPIDSLLAQPGQVS